MKSMTEALTLGNFLRKKNDRKRIPIGSHFQVQVLPWNGITDSIHKEIDGQVDGIEC